MNAHTVAPTLPRRTPQLVVIIATAVLLSAASFQSAWAQTAPTLGTAQSFAVLGGSTVTNTGPTVITGDLGVSPGTAVTGFPPGIVIGGTIHAADAVALQAQSDTTTAYNNLAGQACNFNLTGHGSRWADARAGRLLLFVLGSVDGSAHSRRRGRPRCGLGVPDREHPHDGEQLVRAAHQWRSTMQRLLAGRQLRDSRYDHYVHRKYSRAHEHHPHYQRKRVR